MRQLIAKVNYDSCRVFFLEMHEWIQSAEFTNLHIFILENVTVWRRQQNNTSPTHGSIWPVQEFHISFMTDE